VISEEKKGKIGDWGLGTAGICEPIHGPMSHFFGGEEFRQNHFLAESWKRVEERKRFLAAKERKERKGNGFSTANERE
jgi:hypothetical protein